MSQKNSRCNLLFQAAKNGSVNEFREAIIESLQSGSSLYSELIQCDENGDSPLHVAIKCEHHSLVKYMLKWSKNKIALVESQYCFEDPCKKGGKDYVNIRLEDFANNMFGISYKVPVLYIMEYLINPEVDNFSSRWCVISWLKFVLDCVKVSSINRPEKIVALELLGATFILKHTQEYRNCCSNDGCFIGIKCWKEALALRYASDDGEPALPKIPCVLPDICRPILRDNVEFVTSDQLEHLEQQLMHGKSPENGRINCGKHGLLVVQALLVIQRICSETPNVLLYLQFWFEYGKYLHFYDGDYIRSFNVFHLILNQIKQFNPTQPSNNECLKIFAHSVMNMSNCLIETKKIHLANSEMEKMKSTDLLTLIKFSVTVTALLNVPNPNGAIENSRSSLIWLARLEDAIVLLVDLFPEFNRQETRQLTEYLTEYAQKKFDKIFYSLLQVVVCHFSNNNNQAVNDDNYIQVIQLLLTIGCDPNAITSPRFQSPFYCFAKCWADFRSPNSHRIVFLSLLDAGGNLDQKAKDGTTVRSVLKAQEKLLTHDDPYLDSLFNMSVPLSLCHMCARVIRKDRIPFEDKLPPSLQSFVLCRKI